MQVSAQSRHAFPDRNLLAPEQYPVCLPPLLDLQIFEALRAVLDSATLSHIYAELLKQTRLRLTGLEQATHPDQVQAVAHSICGSAGMLGAATLAAAAAALEAHPTPDENLVRALESMRRGCAALEAALRERQVEL